MTTQIRTTRVHMTSQWRWLYHADDEQLLIKLAEGLVHPAPFKASRLVPLKPMDEPFSLEDATNFQTLFDQLEASDLVSPQIAFTAALNHTIYQRFGRPQMPQSWYFQTAEIGRASCRERVKLTMEVGELNRKDNNDYK